MLFRNIHWFNHLPHLYEIDQLFDFTKKRKTIYIYGCGEIQEYLFKYLEMCDVKNVAGYIVSKKEENTNFLYKEMPIIDIEEANSIEEKDKIGVILGLSSNHYTKVIDLLKSIGIKNYLTLSDHTKLGIAEQTAPRTKDLMTFEVNVCDHCNMACLMCDHYAQLSEKKFLDLEQYKKDIEQMGKLYDHEVRCISLLGGEPTLHPQLTDIIKLTREQFPNAQLIIMTNGIRLLNNEFINGKQNNEENYQNFWQICKENRVDITVTVYPIKLDYIKIEEEAKKYGLNIKLSSDVHAVTPTKQTKITDKHPFTLKGNSPKEYFVRCLYYNKFNVLKDGKLFMCPVMAHIGILNKKFGTNFSYKDGDFVDIYKAKSWEDFVKYSSSRIPFCRYCDLRNWGPCQEWAPSKKELSEYI